MYKTISHTIISLLFIVSIMGPSVYQLCASNTDAVVITISEEEVKEKIILLTDYFSEAIEYTSKNELNVTYVESSCSYNSDIFLPPPEVTL